MKHYKILFVFLSFFVFQNGFTQTFEINNETVFTCGGVFYDDNGGIDGAAGTIGNDYSATSYTYTICPDNPGDGIQVEFVGFSVSQNPNPDNNDVLLIFNGDDTSAPLMGSSNAINFGGITFSANTDNPTGCLTFVFDHNPNNPVSGGWQANIECVTPCSTPYAEGTITSHPVSPENGIQACIGEAITFEDVASTAGAGFTIDNFIWDFGDGTSSIGPAAVDHIYNEPGEYIVALLVEDNNGCTSTNITPYQILVSTLPIFNTDFTEEICLGGEGYINGNPVQSETWTALPPQVVSGETYLADGVGFQFESSLNFNFFEDDQVLESCEDLYGININMEHSYIGDLDIEIECPDGTSVILLDYPNGGGGGYLGEPIDIGGDLTPGVGYDYSWISNAPNGTFGDEAIGASPLPSGNYSAEGDLCDLVGCPLNGLWTLTIVDNLAADDGNIFEWGVDLNPELFPGITTFTPTIGLGVDSTWVEGPHIVNTSADGNLADILPPALGEYEYTLFAANNFGCTFDTTVVVEVVTGPVVDAGLDLQICNDPVQLEATIISNEFDAGPCVFTLELTNDGGFGFNNSGVDVYFDDVLFQSFTSTAISQEFEIEVPSGQTMTLDYIYSTWGEGDGNIVYLYNDNGDLIFESDQNPDEGDIFDETVVCAGDGQLQWEWTPADDLSNPIIPNPVASNTQSVDYTVTVYPEGFEGCASSDVVSVTVDPAGDPGTDSTLILCYNFGQFDLIEMLGGTPVNTGVWTDGNGDVIPGTFNTLTDLGDVFTYTVTNNGCQNSAQVDLTVLPQGDPACCVFDYEETVSDALCNGNSDGIYEITLFDSTEGGPWQVEIDSGNGAILQTADNSTTFTDLPAGTYNVEITDAGLCYTSFQIDVLEPPVIPITAVADSTICLTGTATLEAWSSADLNNDFVYTWVGIGDGDQAVSPSVLTLYEVFATTPNGCLSPTEEVEINVYEPLTLSASADVLNCQNQLDSLEVLASDGGFGGFFYSWTSNGVQVGTDDLLEVSPIATQEYCVTLTDGCETPSIQECITVNVEPTPVIELFSTDPSGCVPFEIYFENQSNADDYVNTYWQIANQAYNPENNATHLFETPGTYDISMTLESDLGCFYETVYPNYATIFASPEPNFYWNPYTPTIPESTIEFTNLTDGFITSYSWVFDTLNVLGTSTTENPTFEFPYDQGGAYPTSLTVTDVNGCTATETFLVEIYDPLNIYVPTAFTPNSDGINDVLAIKGTDIDPQRFEVLIFNRLGEVVYRSSDVEGVWDASFNGGDYYVPPGVYTYRIDYYSLKTTQRYEKTGHVTVIR